VGSMFSIAKPQIQLIPTAQITLGHYSSSVSEDILENLPVVPPSVQALQILQSRVSLASFFPTLLQHFSNISIGLQYFHSIWRPICSPKDNGFCLRCHIATCPSQDIEISSNQLLCWAGVSFKI
jgi:hypothetical protein